MRHSARAPLWTLALLFQIFTWTGCAQAELPVGETRQARDAQPSYVEGELIVKFKPGAFDRDAFEAGQPPESLLPPGVSQVLETQQISLKTMEALYPRTKQTDPSREKYGFDHVFKLAFQTASGSAAIPALIQALTDTGEIEYAEPNYIAHTLPAAAGGAAIRAPEPGASTTGSPALDPTPLLPEDTGVPEVRTDETGPTDASAQLSSLTTGSLPEEQEELKSFALKYLATRRGALLGGLAPETALRLASLNVIAGKPELGISTMAYLSFLQVVNETVAVEGSFVNLTVQLDSQQARIVSIRGRIFPTLSWPEKPSLTAPEAQGKAAARLDLPQGVQAASTGERVRFIGGQWRMVEEFTFPGRGSAVVAVDLASGEAWAWDAAVQAGTAPTA